MYSCTVHKRYAMNWLLGPNLIPNTLPLLKVDSLYRGTIADRSGIRVGHQIIELNGCSIVDVPHENVVRMLQTTIGHVS